MRLSARAQRDQALKPEVARVFAENFAVYGVRKVWRHMLRKCFSVASCTVERLMCDMGLQGRDPGQAGSHDDERQDSAVPAGSRQPQVLRASAEHAVGVGLHPGLRRGRLYVAALAGFVYVAFVIDTSTRRIVGWRASRTAHASFVLNALEHALHNRRPTHLGGLIHHSDRGSQYVSIKYTECLVEAGDRTVRW